MFQDDSTPNGVGGGVELSQDDSTPREAEGPRGDKTPGALTASRYQRGEYGRGWGRGDENPPTARATRGQGPNGGDGAARCGGTATPDAAMETAEGDGGTGHLPEHFDSADGATIENGKHPRREYDNVASEASERGPASAGHAEGEEGHGAMYHSAGQAREEEGDENPKRASLVQEPDGRDMEEQPPPNGCACLTRAAAKGEKGGEVSPSPKERGGHPPSRRACPLCAA